MKINKIISKLSGRTSLFFGILSLLIFAGMLTFFTIRGAGDITSDSTNSGQQSIANDNIGLTASTNQTPAPVIDFAKVPLAAEDDHIRGNTGAKITLIEYADFQCQFCARQAEAFKQLIDEYKDEVRLVYRHFPLSHLHPLAQKAAEASECANDQGKFWEMHDLIFANQSILSLDNLKSLAIDLKLDTKKFNECLDGNIYVSKVLLQMKGALEAGVPSTPTIFIDKEFIRGYISYEDLLLVIREKNK